MNSFIEGNLTDVARLIGLKKNIAEKVATQKAALLSEKAQIKSEQTRRLDLIKQVNQGLELQRHLKLEVGDLEKNNDDIDAKLKALFKQYKTDLGALRKSTKALKESVN